MALVSWLLVITGMTAKQNPFSNMYPDRSPITDTALRPTSMQLCQTVQFLLAQILERPMEALNANVNTA